MLGWLVWAACAQEVPVRTEHLADCPLPAAELPASAWFTADDPRWARDGVIVVQKAARRVAVYDQGARATLADGNPACWKVGLGAGYPAGHKVREGDMRTPEGWYRTSDRPWSTFYAALTVHYPTRADAERGLRDGLITADQARAITAADAAGTLPPMETPLGGQILLHGGGSASDWTLGCVALEDAEIDALRARLPADKRSWVLILP